MRRDANAAPRGGNPRGGDGTANDNISRLLEALKSGPRSRRELEATLHARRNALCKKYLRPAERKGLVVKTERGSSPSQKYQLARTVIVEEQEAGQVRLVSGSGSSNPASDELNFSEKQAEPQENGISTSEAVLRAREDAPVINLVRYHRWTEGEKALIEYFRVERVLRDMLATEDWKKFGVVNKLGKATISYGCTLFNPLIWGCTGGVTLSVMEYDESGQLRPRVVGESNLLRLLSSHPTLDLSVCSSAEWTEMMELSSLIPPKELYLTRYYEQYFNIPRGLKNPYHGNGKVIPVAVDPFAALPCPRMIFHGKAGAIQFQLLFIDLGNCALFLPVKYYASIENPTAFCIMPEVPDSPVLFNSEVIEKNPGAVVVLTDEIGIPLVNGSSGNYVFSTWYGGMEVIDKLDFDLLDGHPLQWLCTDDGDDPKKTYEKAVTVGTIFQKHGLKIAFQVFDGVTWTRNEFGMETGTYQGSRVLSFDELKAEASKFGVSSCDSNEVADLHIYTMDELLKLKPEEFILAPVLMPGFYCLIYGGSGVAKTWFALHLAICLSQSQAPFKHWEFCGTAPLNVLYVAGEMRPSVYGKRLGQLLAEQESNPHFGLIREDIDLTTEVDQKTIIQAVKELKSKVVVLDNLSTLATNGHTEGQFEIILSFIRKLQADGIIVLLVHHENREGGFKGSGKIELVADQSLHLFSAGNGDKIELLVRAEKIRMTSRAEQAAFRTEFDPDHPVEVWPMFELTEEQRRRLDIDDPLGEVERNVGKKRNDKRLAWRFLNDDDRAIAIIDDTLSGCRDDVIAANLAVREIAIVEFKQQFGITEDALNHHLPMARELAEKNEGKITPNALASEIWKRLKPKD